MSRKERIRTLPPLIVSVIVAALLMCGAIKAIGRYPVMKTEASELWVQETAGIEHRPTEIATTPTVFTEYITAEPEETQDSLIYSRDWGSEDSEILLQIAMAEAEGESVEGKALVMLVVLNRVWSDGFPDSIEEVVFQKVNGVWQFSPVMPGGRYWRVEPNAECYEALEMVMQGWDESKGALYFESCEGDSWHSENLELLFQEGGHKFYK